MPRVLVMVLILIKASVVSALGTSCESPLGMESGGIPNGNIGGSESLTNYEPHKARTNQHKSDSAGTNFHYSVVFGKVNMYTPVFNETVYIIYLEYAPEIGITPLFTLAAIDPDGDTVLFSLQANAMFSVDTVTGVVTAKQTVLYENEYEIKAVLTDDGVPLKSAERSIRITITIGNTTQLTTKMTTTPGRSSDGRISTAKPTSTNTVKYSTGITSSMDTTNTSTVTTDILTNTTTSGTIPSKHETDKHVSAAEITHYAWYIYISIGSIIFNVIYL